MCDPAGQPQRLQLLLLLDVFLQQPLAGDIARDDRRADHSAIVVHRARVDGVPADRAVRVASWQDAGACLAAHKDLSQRLTQLRQRLRRDEIKDARAADLFRDNPRREAIHVQNSAIPIDQQKQIGNGFDHRQPQPRRVARQTPAGGLRTLLDCHHS